MGYNGWSNYETWCVNLWISNDEGSYKYWKEVAERATSVRDLERQLEDEMQERLPALEGFAADLLNAAFGEVDFQEIAQNMWTEYHTEESEEEES